jgi:hypothetical protein
MSGFTSQEASYSYHRRLMKKKRLVIVIGMAAVLLFGCSRTDSGAAIDVASDPTERLPAKYKTREEVPKPDFSEAARSPAFQQAIKEMSGLLASQPQPLLSPAERTVFTGGVSFDVTAKRIEAILLEEHKKLLEKGFYLFRYEQNFGLGDRSDKVGLLPTTDKYAVMAAMDTNGDNYNIGTAGVILWMKDLEKDHRFLLTGIGYDYMEGQLTGPIADAQQLAERMYEFCPDIVDQGVGDKDKLAAELKKGKLYFWWD